MTHKSSSLSSEHLAAYLQAAVCPYTNSPGSPVQHALHRQRDLRPHQRIDTCTSRGRPSLPNSSSPYTQTDNYHPVTRVSASGRRQTFAYLPVPSLRVDELATNEDGGQS